MIWGYHYFRKHPYDYLAILTWQFCWRPFLGWWIVTPLQWLSDLHRSWNNRSWIKLPGIGSPKTWHIRSLNMVDPGWCMDKIIIIPTWIHGIWEEFLTKPPFFGGFPNLSGGDGLVFQETHSRDQGGDQRPCVTCGFFHRIFLEIQGLPWNSVEGDKRIPTGNTVKPHRIHVTGIYSTHGASTIQRWVLQLDTPPKKR